MNSLLTILDSNLFIGLLTVTIGGVVMLMTYASFTVSGVRTNPLRRRLAALGKPEHATRRSSTSSLGNTLRPLGTYLLPKKAKERETIDRKLIHAGYRSETAVFTLYVIKALLIVVFPLAVVTWLLTQMQLHLAYVFFFGFLAAFIGMLIPNVYLNRIIEARQREMMNALPDALDLMVSCTEAGLGMNAALQRVARQMDISSVLLARELELVNAEIRGGVDRIVALKNLTQRTGLDEIRGLVSLLSQSVRFGTPIADILRIYAEEFRDKRTQRAEEQAALVGTKLIFPLCVCIFPAFFIVTVGPAVIGVIRAMAASNF